MTEDEGIAWAINRARFLRRFTHHAPACDCGICWIRRHAVQKKPVISANEEHARTLEHFSDLMLFNQPNRDLWAAAWRALRDSRMDYRSEELERLDTMFHLACAAGAWLEASTILRPKRWLWRMDEMDKGDFAGDCRAQLICRRDTFNGLSMGTQAPAGPNAEARARVAVVWKVAAAMLRTGMRWAPGIPK